MAVRDIKGIDKSKIEILVNLEFERVISTAENLRIIPKQTEENRKDLAYSLYQALMLYVNSAKKQETLKTVYCGHDEDFIAQEP